MREIEIARRKLEGPLPKQPRAQRGGKPRLQSNMTRPQSRRRAQVQGIHPRRRYFSSGAQPALFRQHEADPFDIYRALRVVNPSPYMYFLKLDDAAVVGSSPEMLVKVQDRDAFYRPIAGTRPARPRRKRRPAPGSRTGRRSQGARRAHHARRSRPQRSGPRLRIRLGEAERLMIRRALLARDAPGLELRGATPRRGSRLLRRAGRVLSGGHRLRRAQSSRHGNHRRARADAPRHLRGRGPVYGFLRQLDSCIAIRTMVVKRGRAYVQAGGGLVADSVPEREYQENVKQSARAVRRRWKWRMASAERAQVRRLTSAHTELGRSEWHRCYSYSTTTIPLPTTWRSTSARWGSARSASQRSDYSRRD